MLGTVDKDEILEDIEPVLRRLGLIYPSARGREITEAGREYLAAHRYSEG
jgi:Holliday junction resolvasome RuvABC ATP-dependent DNA helicase subunit